ncbi:checkpoint protein HUS1-like [Homarus americanus]|uniref:Checkpoint protein n=1 Tax=Homarus americanus TaxID=6706 RepID=A0A8J5JDT9_HOMAM|nr:checkpoint protein HUS1-like [Homarus americanus]KAG7155985.1 Checkpoint protein HUS1-like [Homarus americanus]
MKFRGKMVDITCIKQFSNIVSTVARLSKICVLRITKEHVYFIIHESGAVESSPGLWAELDQGHFFNEFHVEGVSQEDNQIFLELEPDKLSKTLNSFKTAQPAPRSLKVKLTRKHSPCLTLEVELPSLSVHARTVVHDVPVTLIPRRQWHVYQEPEMPQFDSSVYLPPLRQIKHVVDRMKTLSQHITFSANRRGTLIISVSTDVVDVSTHFKNLSVPVWGDDNDTGGTHSATVDIKKLGLLLQGSQINPTKVICNIVANRMVHMFLLHDDVTLQYFLPAATNT